MSDEDWEELDERVASALQLSSKDCSCKCRKNSFEKRTLREARNFVLDKEHL